MISFRESKFLFFQIKNKFMHRINFQRYIYIYILVFLIEEIRCNALFVHIEVVNK